MLTEEQKRVRKIRDEDSSFFSAIISLKTVLDYCPEKRTERKRGLQRKEKNQEIGRVSVVFLEEHELMLLRTRKMEKRGFSIPSLLCCFSESLKGERASSFAVGEGENRNKKKKKLACEVKGAAPLFCTCMEG
jgi:hypothetical protein